MYLLKKRPYLNAKDLLNRTPLYFAVKQRYQDLIEKILLLRADPFTNQAMEIDYYSLCDYDGPIVDLIRKFRRVKYLLI